MEDISAGQNSDLLSSVEAGKRFGYTNDYVAKLAREGKVKALRIGRQWFVDQQSVRHFITESEVAKQQRADRIREERKLELCAAEEARKTKGFLAVVPKPRSLRSRKLVALESAALIAMGALVGAFLFVTTPAADREPASVLAHGAAMFGHCADDLYRRADETPCVPGLEALDLDAALGTLFTRATYGISFAMRELWCDAVALFVDDACMAPKIETVEPAPESEPSPEPEPAVAVASAPTHTIVQEVSESHPLTVIHEDSLAESDVRNIVNDLLARHEDRDHGSDDNDDPVPVVQYDLQVEQIYDDIGRSIDGLADDIGADFDAIGESFTTNLLAVSGNAGIEGQLAVAGDTGIQGTLQVAGDTTLSSLAVERATATHATTTTLYTQSASGIDLTYANATSTNLFATNLRATNGTVTSLSATSVSGLNLSYANGNIGTAVISALNVTTASSTNIFTDRLTATAATTTDFHTSRLSVDSFALGSGISSHFVPSANDTYDLGSPSFFWRNGYIDTLAVNNISAASTSIGGTASESLTINSDNATFDTEDMSLIFYRGSVVPNAVLSWDSARDRFAFNQPLYIENQSGSTTQATLTLKGLAGQTGNLFEIASSTGNTVFSVAYDGAVTISTTTITALTTGTSTITNLSVTNTSTSTFAGSVSLVGLAASGPAYFGSTLTVSGLGDFQNGFISRASSTVAGNFTTTGTSYFAANVGIGTSTPDHTLVVNASGATVAAFDRASIRLASINGGNDDFNLVPRASANVRIGAFGSAAFNVLANGNVGIGTTSPAYALDAWGTTPFQVGRAGVGAWAERITNNISGASVAGELQFQPTGSQSSNLSAVSIGNVNGVSQHAFFTNGNAFHLGNVGIGTSSPQSLLQVGDGIGATVTYPQGSSIMPALLVSKSNGPAALMVMDADGVSNRRVGLFADQTNGLTGLSASASTGQPDFVFNIGGSERMRFVAATGNVGIGTTSPGQKLSVAGDALFSGNLTSTGGNLTLGQGATVAQAGKVRLSLGDAIMWERSDLVNVVGIGYDASGTMWFGGSQTGSTSASLVINNSGRIGVGVTSPVGGASRVLHISGTQSELHLTNTTVGETAADGLMLQSWSDSGGYLWNRENSFLSFGTNNAERMRIDAAGNVGIGTTTPSAALAVATNGNVNNTYLRGSSNSNYVLTVSNGGGAARGLLVQGGNSLNSDSFLFRVEQPDGSSFFTVTDGNSYFQNGNVGIGISSPTHLLQVNGEIFVPNKTGYISVGTYGSISEAGGGLAYVQGNNLRVSPTNNNKFYKSNSQTDPAQYIAMRYDRGLYFGTGLGAGDAVGTEYDDGANVRMALGLTGNVGLGGSITNLTTMTGATLVANSNGNVGIGTSTPTGALNLYRSAASATQFVMEGGSPEMFMKDLNETGIFRTIVGPDGYHIQPGTGSAQNPSWNSVALTVAPDGKVGIGTDSPDEALTVAGNIMLTDNHFLALNTNGGISYKDGYAPNGGNDSIVMENGNTEYISLVSHGASAVNFFTNDTERLHIGANGNIGIGTSDPQTNLDINSTGNAILSFHTPLTGTSAADGFEFSMADDGDAFVWNYENKPIYFGTNNAERLFISPNGDIGIGTSGPAYTLDVNGSIGSRSNAVFGYVPGSSGGVYVTKTSLYGAPAVQSVTNAFAPGILALNPAGGSVGIGTTTAPYATFVTGAIANIAGSLQIGRANNSYNGIDILRGDGSAGNFVMRWNGDNTVSQIMNGSGGGILQLGSFNGTGGKTQIIGNGSAVIATFLNSNGALGIGTTTPGSKLEVAGDVKLSSGATRSLVGPSGTNEEFNLGAGGSNFLDLNNSTGGNIRMFVDHGSGSELSLRVYDYAAASNNYVSISHNGVAGLIHTENSEPLALQSIGGNVGIGISAPTFVTASYGGLQINPSSTGAALRLTNSFTGTAATDGLDLAVDGGGQAFLTNRENALLGFGTNNNTRMVIASSGNVGIGTTSPAQKLAVVGNGQFTDGTHNQVHLAGGGGIEILRTSDDSAFIDYRNSFSEDFDFRTQFNGLANFLGFHSSTTPNIMALTAAGNVGIGTTTPSAQLTTTGTVRFANLGAGTLQTDAQGNLSVSSDERLKDIEGEFTKGLEAILALEPINFTWKKSTGFDTANVYTGFSAQNVRLAIPEAIGEDKHGFLTLSDRPILAAVVNAVKELHASVISLQTTIAGFAGEFFSNRVRTNELCVGSTCVTEVELQALLNESGRASDGHEADGPEPPGPAQTPAPVEGDNGDSEPNDLAPEGAEDPEASAPANEPVEAGGASAAAASDPVPEGREDSQGSEVPGSTEAPVEAASAPAETASDPTTASGADIVASPQAE